MGIKLLSRGLNAAERSRGEASERRIGTSCPLTNCQAAVLCLEGDVWWRLLVLELLAAGLDGNADSKLRLLLLNGQSRDTLIWPDAARTV